MTIDPKTAGFNLERMTSDTRRQLSILGYGEAKFGKTHLALTMPGPIGYIDMDLGTRGVIEKFAGEKEIWRASIDMPMIIAKSAKDDLKSTYGPKWAEFGKAFHYFVKNARSIVVDTWTEAYQLAQLATFGSLSQNNKFGYGAIYAELKGFLNAADRAGTNVFLIQRTKDEYKNDAKTGKRVPAGYKDTQFDVDVVLRMDREKEGDKDFFVEVMACRQNSALLGEVIGEPMNTFPIIASMVYDQTTPEEWE